MTDFSKATPRPWTSSEALGTHGEFCFHSIDGNGDYEFLLASVGSQYFIDGIWQKSKEKSQANAALIVHAVNNHEPMLEALKAAQAALAMMVDESTIKSTSTAIAYANCIQAGAKARAAIAAAEGEQS